MAFQLDILVTLSVLDRLVDDAPKSPTEPALTRAESLRRLRTSVRRDLEWLLNTRRVAEMPEENLHDLNRSVYVYGLPDISSVSLSSRGEQERLLRAIERSIATFEPRLRDVKVIPIRDKDQGKVQRLDFRIEGLLMMDPAPEAVTFDTVLDGVSQTYRIKSDTGEAV